MKSVIFPIEGPASIVFFRIIRKLTLPNPPSPMPVTGIMSRANENLGRTTALRQERL
jgi:hypothetical protein